MIIESVQTGSVREIAAGTRRAVHSAIDKRPTDAIEVAHGHVAGDHTQDPSAHGGEGQAVSLYARSDYAVFEDEFGTALAPGSFGENVTVDTWWTDASGVRVGDRLTSGDVELEITGARVPCQKFAARMTELIGPDAGVGWVRHFTRTRRPGWYARVVRPGRLAPGDELVCAAVAPSNFVTALELFDLATSQDVAADVAADVVRRALASPVDHRIHAWLQGMTSP